MVRMVAARALVLLGGPALIGGPVLIVGLAAPQAMAQPRLLPPAPPKFYPVSPIPEVTWSCDLTAPSGEQTVLHGKFAPIDASPASPRVMNKYGSADTSATIEDGSATGSHGTYPFKYNGDDKYQAISKELHRGLAMGYVEIAFELEGFQRAFLRITDNAVVRELSGKTQSGLVAGGSARPTLWAGYCTMDADPRVGVIAEAAELGL